MVGQNIKSTFSPKSDLVLAEIMKKNKLEGSSVGFSLEKITMFFSRAEISEKEAIDSIQKEVGVSLKVAEQIVAEIKNTLIPTLWNNLSQKDKELLLHRKNPEETKKEVPEKKPVLPDKKNDIVSEPLEKSAPPIIKKASGPDTYREPIE